MRKNVVLIDFLRRLGIRTILELSQGVSVKNTEKEKKDDDIPEGIEESLNIPYINRDGIPLAMDVFQPKGPEYDGKELPVIVSIHGGGLVTGDRKISRNISRELASRGYLVFAIEYRLAPRATVCEQLDDVCAGMDFVGMKLVKYDVDFSRIFMTADSAGALLAIYTAAMKKSKKLQDTIGHKPSRMVFKAIGLSCGMFYTNRNDILGQMLSEQFYGDKLDDENFLQYMNPEHPEIVSNLPPTFLVTSRGDFLNNYTVMYESALKKAGNKTKMLYYPGRHLIHTFNFSRPWLPESRDANDKMLAFFEAQADAARSMMKDHEQEKRKRKDIETMMEDGRFAKQRLWEAVFEANAYSPERMQTDALLDGEKKYTYRQMFRKWDEYAEVFSSVGMTGKKKARVCMPGAMTTEAVLAFYALNKVGASVSLMPYEALSDTKQFLGMVKSEEITDLVLTDFTLTEKLVKALAEHRESYGIRNMIILETNEGKKQKQSAALKHLLRQTEGVSFMPELLIRYEAMPIETADEKTPKAVTILHKKMTDGTFEPVEFTDAELNTVAIGMMNDAKEYAGDGKDRLGLSSDLSCAAALSKQLQYCLLFNHTLVLSDRTGYNKNFHRNIERFRINTLVVYPHMLDLWMKQLADEKLYFSSLDRIFLEDTGVTKEQLAEYRGFLEKHKCAAVVLISREKAKDHSHEPAAYGTPDLSAADTQKSAAIPSMLPVPAMPYAPGMMPVGRMPAQSSEEDEKKRGRIESLRIVIPPLVRKLAEKQMKKQGDDDAKEDGSFGFVMDLASVLFSANKTDYYYEA